MNALYNATYFGQDKFDHVVTRHPMHGIKTNKWTIHEFRNGLDILLTNAITICRLGVKDPKYKKNWTDPGELMMAIVSRYKDQYIRQDEVNPAPKTLNISSVVSGIMTETDGDADDELANDEVGNLKGTKKRCRVKKCTVRSHFRCAICRETWCSGEHGARVCKSHIIGM